MKVKQETKKHVLNVVVLMLVDVMRIVNLLMNINAWIVFPHGKVIFANFRVIL